MNDLGGGVQFQQTKTDFSPGPLQRTGAATDVAMPGDGFFVVRKGQETFLTRAGNFRLTAAGELVTQQGYPVLSDEQLAGHDLARRTALGTITDRGAVAQAGSSQNLAMVQAGVAGRPGQGGREPVPAAGRVRPCPPADASVAGGYLEMSGVQPTTEMTSHDRGLPHGARPTST